MEPGINFFSDFGDLLILSSLPHGIATFMVPRAPKSHQKRPKNETKTRLQNTHHKNSPFWRNYAETGAQRVPRVTLMGPSWASFFPLFPTLAPKVGPRDSQGDPGTPKVAEMEAKWRPKGAQNDGNYTMWNDTAHTNTQQNSINILLRENT